MWVKKRVRCIFIPNGYHHWGISLMTYGVNAKATEKQGGSLSLLETLFKVLIDIAFKHSVVYLAALVGKAAIGLLELLI